MFGYCSAWSEERKAAERRHYRLACRLRCLEAALDRTDLQDFDALMDEIERTHELLQTAGAECLRFRVEEAAELPGK